MDKICGIYKILSPSGRVYIGESKDIENRKKYYISNHNSIIKQTKLYKSLKKYGWDAHSFKVIEECKFEELLCRERYWQDFYNVLDGGLNCVLTNCGSTKMEFSESIKKGRSDRAKGKSNPNYGKKMSEETKDKIRSNRRSYSGENHPNYGKKMEFVTRNNLLKKIVIDLETGIFYDIREASELLTIKYTTLVARLDGRVKNKTNLTYC